MLHIAQENRAIFRLKVHEVLLREQLLLRLAVLRVVHATVHGAHRGTLRFIVEPDAFRALLVGDEVDIHAHGGMHLVGVHIAGGRMEACAAESGSIGKLPRRSTFVNGVVRAFGLAGSAIDAGVGNDDGHGCSFVCKDNGAHA